MEIEKLKEMCTAEEPVFCCHCCDDQIYAGALWYDIDNMVLCQDCADAWLGDKSRIAEEADRYV